MYLKQMRSDMKRWIYRQVVARGASNLFYFVMLGVFLVVQAWDNKILAAAALMVLLVGMILPDPLNVGNWIIRWEKRRWPDV